MVFSPISVLPQVGSKRAEVLHHLGIDTIYQLLTFFPFRYDDIQSRNVSDLFDQERVTLKGTVVSLPSVQHYGRRRSRLSFRLAVGYDVVRVVFFNQPYLTKQIQEGNTLAVFGKWDATKQVLTAMKLIAKADEDKPFAPVYHTTKDIRQSTLVKLIQTALEQYGDAIPEVLPSQLRQQYRLWYHRDAVKAMHQPEQTEATDEAKRQLIYQEFFVYQWRIQQKRFTRLARQEQPIHYDVHVLKQLIHTLPFELTADQKQAVNDICRDLLAPFPMNRLLQGDVGSGKTVVATVVMVAMALAGYQSVMMVPTEILAQQHYQTIQQFCQSMPDVTIALLTGSTTTKQRQQLLVDLAAGKITILIGTHALIESDVVWQRLGLAIIDEQHRFGVKQRERLKGKLHLENVLYMTATPIPRTLAIALMGDMDISAIKEAPSGRLPIITEWHQSQAWERVFEGVSEQLAQGRQAYVVAPLIEESEALDVQHAEALYTSISQYYGQRYRVGLLHGRLSNDDKQQVMAAFQENRIQILVSTTVIEVGVNVANATVMVIQDADRFGLAQLHQLRGRVGRSSFQSYCFLIASPTTDYGKARMKIMCDSQDGFYLSEQDLQMRGSGDIFGINQSGLPKFHLADIVRDGNVLAVAQRDVLQYFNDSDYRASAHYNNLKQLLTLPTELGESHHDENSN